MRVSQGSDCLISAFEHLKLKIDWQKFCEKKTLGVVAGGGEG